MHLDKKLVRLSQLVSLMIQITGVCDSIIWAIFSEDRYERSGVPMNTDSIKRDLIKRLLLYVQREHQRNKSTDSILY